MESKLVKLSLTSYNDQTLVPNETRVIPALKSMSVINFPAKFRELIHNKIAD